MYSNYLRKERNIAPSDLNPNPELYMNGQNETAFFEIV